MISQTLHFEVSGQEAQLLLQACKERNIEPAEAFELFIKQFARQRQQQIEGELRAKKLAYAGALSQFANADLIPLEERAVEMAIAEKYRAD